MKQMSLITFLRKIFFETLRVTGIEITAWLGITGESRNIVLVLVATGCQYK